MKEENGIAHLCFCVYDNAAFLGPVLYPTSSNYHHGRAHGERFQAHDSKRFLPAGGKEQRRALGDALLPSNARQPAELNAAFEFLFQRSFTGDEQWLWSACLIPGSPSDHRCFVVYQSTAEYEPVTDVVCQMRAWLRHPGWNDAGRVETRLFDPQSHVVRQNHCGAVPKRVDARLCQCQCFRTVGRVWEAVRASAVFHRACARASVRQGTARPGTKKSVVLNGHHGRVWMVRCDSAKSERVHYVLHHGQVMLLQQR